MGGGASSSSSSSAATPNAKAKAGKTKSGKPKSAYDKAVEEDGLDLLLDVLGLHRKEAQRYWEVFRKLDDDDSGAIGFEELFEST